MKKNVIAILLAVCMLLALTACAAKAPTADTASDNTAADAAPAETPADTTENTEEPSADDGKVYTVGICQLVQHDALDAATQGFKDALTEALGDKVVFEEQNASNDIPTCGTIVHGLRGLECRPDPRQRDAGPAGRCLRNADHPHPRHGCHRIWCGAGH